MAGHLLEMDPENYAEYYHFLVEQSGSKDFEVAEAAMGSLGMASGEESIDLLIHYLGDARPGIPDSAAEALSYRRVIIENKSIRSEERVYLKDRIDAVCKASREGWSPRKTLCS